ncbi:MAG TPA: DNA polymerase III subunit beta [Methyloprofundus sp.]|uniref:DNA polymerase III subunit beta n=1 Tax=Methyloprofundus sp. TaxID=2020875 RepID=UPI001807BD5B|nr:DNA polymerase III subunit beta [Methyloprofundus sp.]HIG64156.1 DNA polymerase III subunit beta [Methyloprofundus sp.]HIL78786.1 DNA polymerase III subunit beta [Methylococcales bacterium]
MKFTINRELLLTPLQQIVNVIEKRQTMPILANVLFQLEKNQLTLTGTDLEVQIVAKLALENEVEGSITVPARKLLDICRLLPSAAEIKFELIATKLKIQSGRSRFMVSTLIADEYPGFEMSAMDCQFVMPSSQLKKALDKTTFCMANQDIRYYLNGIMLSIFNQQLKLVGSDGHRLSIYEDSIAQETGIELRVIIPRKGVLELARLLEEDQEVQVELSRNNIRVVIDNLIFSAKLVDSKYPDFSKVFEQKFYSSIHVQKQLLKEALTRVAILSNEKFRGVEFVIDGNNLQISTNNPEHEEADEEISIEYQGQPLSIAFNSQYILDAISNLDSELAVLTIAENSSCCFIEEPSEQKYKFIVMPMRL